MKQTVIISLICLSLLVGCGSNDNGGTDMEDPFLGGTEGLIISFEEDTPPTEVFDGGEFPFGIVVKLQNDGEQPVMKDDILVTISGILASEFGKQESELILNPTEDLEGNKKDSDGKKIESNPVHVEFGDFNHLGELSGNTPYTFRADVCYKYGTTANTLLCIRKDNLDRDEGVCVVNEDKKVFSSGAPIQIIDFKESARAKDKVAFTFTIAHKGNGDIFEPESKCDGSFEKENKIWVEIETGIEGALECSGLKDGTEKSGYVTMYGSDKQITCSQLLTTNSDYQKSITIKLTYDYKENKETKVLVKHAIN